MCFGFFCQSEEVGKIDHACGVGLVKSNAAFVCEGGHGRESVVKGSPVVADVAAVLIGHRIPARIL